VHFGQSVDSMAEGIHLVLEIDVDAAIEQEDLLRRFHARRLPWISLGVFDGSCRFGHWPALQALPIARLRIPAAALNNPNEAARSMIARWRSGGRSLIADGVASPAELSGLWAIGVDHVAGDAIAPASARPDWDFGAH
jgi:EAL domain-containing protein (putative c-di-GMP-specific phosphodiesterase class I)